MDFQTLLRKDYTLVLLISILYFLTIKEVVPEFAYLVIAVMISIYFFPIKLLLGNDISDASNKKKVTLAVSYFVISNIIALTALTAYFDRKGLILTAIHIYSFINFAFLLHFHFKENMRYNVILSVCTIVLTSAMFATQFN